mmetsp:Transcript_45931/g.121452  ORF Transcript_45931/g.121452 Transcript_45931/m.121452 type:complete len:162 (-) Transcript_45931:103-588(-)
MPGVLGICFGHQILAKALGGRVERNSTFGVQLGKRRFAIGESPLAREKLSGLGQQITSIAAHGDAVMEIPPGAESLGQSTPCCYEGFVTSNGRVITFQCHPEFGGSPFGREAYLGLVDAMENAGEVEGKLKARRDTGDTDDQALRDAVLAHFEQTQPKSAL